MTPGEKGRPCRPDCEELYQISFLLGRAYYSYIGMLERLLEETGLGEFIKPGMGNLLFALFREDDRTISDVARELQLARSTMTGMVARMKKARLITVVKDPRDWRAVRLKLTPLARSLEGRCHELADHIERLLVDDLEPPEAEALRRSLSKLIGTINRQLQAGRKAVSGGRRVSNGC